MFPFTLAGPQFLVFYLGLGAVVLALMWALRRRGEATLVPRSQLSDPYLIAYLRGGKNEAIRVATVSLVDRGFLDVNDSKLKSAGREAIALARRPLEKALLQRYLSEAEAKEAFDEPVFETATQEYQQRLEADGLIPDEATRSARMLRLLGALAVLWLVGGSRVVQGLGRDKPVLFLVGLGSLFSVLAVALHNPRRTAAGDAILADLRQLFAGLRERAAVLEPGGATAEAALLAGVFGLTALPATQWAFTRKLYPKAKSGDSSSWSSSCGSSCGSACGSSCGGGCGGGCGGCGG